MQHLNVQTEILHFRYIKLNLYQKVTEFMFTSSVKILINMLINRRNAELNLTKNQLTKIGYGEKLD